MPDVTRSDSQRSEPSLRPRVSFNRDVHVKRIVPREAQREAVVGALSGDGGGHFVPTPIRKQRISRSKQELAQEAAKVIDQADKVDCLTRQNGVSPERFYTLPTRKKPKSGENQNSLDRRSRRRNSDDLGLKTAPKKPPRTFATNQKPAQPRSTIFTIFKKNEKPENEPKKPNIRRSVSDATNLKSKALKGSVDHEKPSRRRTGSESEEFLTGKSNKKQLSPIIEVTQREDYFSPGIVDTGEENKENVGVSSSNKPKNRSGSVTDQLKEYIDEVDTAIYKETGVRVTPPKVESYKQPEVVIIDVDKAKKISSGKKSSIGKKLKALTSKKAKVTKTTTKEATKNNKSKQPQKQVSQGNNSKKNSKPKRQEPIGAQRSESKGKSDLLITTAPRIREAIEILENQAKKSPTMIHSSQKPPDKPPLTKGRTVDSMVKRLSMDNTSPPPKSTNVLIAPNVGVQHNNNQPFSYTRGISPEKSFSNQDDYRNSNTSPIIYAQVVCGQNGNGIGKQTVHTAYTNGKKHLPHSDSDEGLGYEESFGRKYESEKTTTRFGDEFNNKRNIERYDEEYPITPKFKNIGFNGFDYEKNDSEFPKTERIFIDSSSRGRGDGMDAKRRESLTEPFDSLNSPTNHFNGHQNGRSDLSARRDQLESRIIRRMGEKTIRQSPEYNSKSPTTNVYISESSSRYYRSGSDSPVGYKEKYTAETKMDKRGEKYTTESRSKEYFGGERNKDNYDNRYRKYDYRYNNFENEPKSLDSQISDYRSSAENVNGKIFESSHGNHASNKYRMRSEKQIMNKDRNYYKSNPEINQTSQDYKYESDKRYPEAYHDSLKRDKHEGRINSSSKYITRTERYFDHNEKKDKFGDSGIENDFRRDSGENFRRIKQNGVSNNESEDEGFASSLLIASERQHTDDLVKKKQRKEFELDRSFHREDHYRNEDTLEYKKFNGKDRNEYAPRERSIDDGSHFDPRLDKEVDRSTLKRISDKKPPKPEKKSSLERVKQLFTRDSKKTKKDKEKGLVREESLRARYTEYKGSTEELDPKLSKKSSKESHMSYDNINRRRLSTPSPSPTREPKATKLRNGKLESNNHSWFKSLDRLSRKKSRKGEKEANFTSADEETVSKQPPLKNLRFFGDTDVESGDSIRQKSAYKTRSTSTINRNDRTRSQSSRDLHNITEERRSPDVEIQKSHKSMMNISGSERDVKGSRTNLKPPMSPNHRHKAEVSRTRDERNRRRKTDASPVESSTEGDSSQQSQRSVVYLHAATVGDIPGPGYLRNGRRAASREELASNSSSRIQPQVKTLSRSFSVLAPWKPRHYRESMDIDYTQYPKATKNGKYEQKTTKTSASRKESSSTLKKKAAETRRSNQNMSTLSRRSRSKENVSSSQTLKRNKDDNMKSSSSTLYKKKERQPKENTRYSSNKDDRKMSSKSMSVESLGSNRRHRDDMREVSRSTSMPRDPEKSAGWFRMNKKSKKSNSMLHL